jgi:hypothetical protein
MASPSATMISNATSTQNILSSQKVIDMSDRIYLLEPQAAPLYVLVSRLNKRVAINTTVQWLEDVLNPSWTTLAISAVSAVSANYTTLSVSNAYINTFDLIKIPSTGEICLIVSGGGSTAVSAARCYGGTMNASTAGATHASAVSAAAASDVVIIGSAFVEGSSSTALSTMSTKVANVSNYLQIFRKSVEITKTMANVELYGGADRPYQRKKKGIELMRDLERAFLFGTPLEDAGTYDTSGVTSGVNARRTTGGLDYFIGTNSTDAGGALTEAEFEVFLRSVFRYGSNTRYLFSAPLILSVISLWAQGKLQMFPKDKTYGIAISQYLSPHGTINLVKELMLENAGGVSSTSYYGGYAFAVELEDVVYRYLQNRDVQFETDIQHPADDFYKDQYICEVGMEFHNELKHGQLYDVTS